MRTSMINSNQFLLLILLLLAPLPGNASSTALIQLQHSATAHITSSQPTSDTPCRCKVTIGWGCSAVGPAVLPSAAKTFIAPGKYAVMALGEQALQANQRPVPLPPPKSH